MLTGDRCLNTFEVNLNIPSYSNWLSHLTRLCCSRRTMKWTIQSMHTTSAIVVITVESWMQSLLWNFQERPTWWDQVKKRQVRSSSQSTIDIPSETNFSHLCVLCIVTPSRRRHRSCVSRLANQVNSRRCRRTYELEPLCCKWSRVHRSACNISETCHITLHNISLTRVSLTNKTSVAPKYSQLLVRG